MNMASTKALGVVLGIFLLTGSVASAEGSRTAGKRSCPQRCAKHLKECSKVCKEKGGPSKQRCLDACQQAEQKCSIKCG
ncbi:hypothetical protein [Stigmatella hybrida]|uniref:hypothetical protein n=1 Tax=Stigmatella hybrida TaxID=394097 RepID=UPI001CDB3839|nr:hypothetical protein [Stigmatella hybrida]